MFPFSVLHVPSTNRWYAVHIGGRGAGLARPRAWVLGRARHRGRGDGHA
jgi:hypothetical protein